MKKFLVNQFHTHRYILSASSSSGDSQKDCSGFSLYLFLYATGILLFVYFSLLVSAVGFFLNIPITSYHLAVSSGLSASVMYLLSRRAIPGISLLKYALVLGMILLTVIISAWSTRNFYDLSYDGQAYHQEMIIALGFGWNPVYRVLTPEKYPAFSYQKLLNSYPKASEIMETAMYRSFNSIESGKGLHILFAAMAWAFTVSFLCRLKSVPLPIILITSLLVVVTPVTITQSLSYYLDSQLYFLLVSQLAVLSTFYRTGKNYCLLPLFACLPVLWNMKFTAVATSAVVSSGFLLYSWYNGKILTFFKTLQVHVVAMILAFLVIGFNPYVTNTIRYGHPLYPASGKNAADYITGNMPSSMYSKSSVERLFLSVFSRSLPVRGVGKTHTIKLPFTLIAKEVESFTGNLTLGGFGPLFSGILLLSLSSLLVVFTGREKPWVKRTLLFLIIFTLLSCTLIPVASYARFVPQLWLIPCFTVMYLLLKPSFIPRTLGLVILFTMGINLYFIAFRYYSWNLTASRRLKEELADLRSLSTSSPVRVDFGDFRSNRIRFAEAGIAYSELPADHCGTGLKRLLADTIVESPIRMCR